MGQTDFTTGDVSGSQTLTDSDHLYPSHINELRAALNLLESLLDPDDETLTTSGKVETSSDIETTGGSLKGDTVSESTAGAGVTVDGVLLKDSQVTTDTINEKVEGNGVTADGVKMKDSQVYTDTIVEKTSGAGVTVDSLLIKDGNITLTDKAPIMNVKARAYLSADQDDITTGVSTKILLNTESYDIGGDFDTTNSKFVTPVAGYYLICGNIQVEGTTGTVDTIITGYIYVDGAAVSRVTLQKSVDSVMSIPIHDIQYIAAGKDVELYFAHNDDSNTPDIDSGETATYFSIHLLSL